MPRACITEEQLLEALWQAYYHNELDHLGDSIEGSMIDGNDHPALKEAAHAIFERLPVEGWT